MNSRLIFLLIALVTAWVLAFNTGNNLAYSVAYLVSGALAFSFLWARNGVRGVQVLRVNKTQRSQVGQFAEEHVEIINRSRLPKLWLELDDRSTLPWHSVARVVTVGRRSNYRWQARTLCTVRGRFRLGPMTLRSGDPLGIFETRRRVPGVGYLVVFPLTVDLPYFEPSISDLAGGEARHRRTYQMTTNAAGVRDYAPGDSLNRIHWPTTARTRRLIAKEFELDPTADVWLYLDLFRQADVSLPWSPAPPEPGLFAMHSVKRQRSQFELPPSTTEYAVTVTASLARYFVMHNRAVGMSSRGRNREFLQADRGERQLNKMLEALAVVEPLGDLPFAQLIATDGVRLNRNDTVVAVSADPNREWAIALQQIQRRGVNSIAVIVDAASFDAPVDYAPLVAQLESTGIPVYTVRRGDALEEALRSPVLGGRRRAAF
jgi:uncharacterized protein (DUF58 family)